MMGVLVTAATKYGATTEIAQAIAAVLGEHGLEAIVLPPEQVEEVEGYDAVVVGSAVYAGHWLKPAKELVERHADLLTATGARDHRVFAGKLVRKRLSFPERAIASALRVPEGDFRDWTEIHHWAAQIAEALPPRLRQPRAGGPVPGDGCQ